MGIGDDLKNVEIGQDKGAQNQYNHQDPEQDRQTAALDATPYVFSCKIEGVGDEKDHNIDQKYGQNQGDFALEYRMVQK